MSDRQNLPNHSANVTLAMDCGPHGTIRLSQADNTFVIASESASVPPCDARIILTVDGQRYERSVQLISGLSPNSKKATVLASDDVSPF